MRQACRVERQNWSPEASLRMSTAVYTLQDAIRRLQGLNFKEVK
jgi:hypothetical protein